MKSATKKSPKQIQKTVLKTGSKLATPKKASAKQSKAAKTAPNNEQICKNRIKEQKVVKVKDMVSLEAIDMSKSEEEIVP